jgi:hypothetical protein
VLGVRPEHAVNPVGGEAERQETLLQLGDVITLEHVAGDVRKHPVAQLPVGPVQGDVGVRPEHSVDNQASSLLKGANCLGHLCVVDVGVLGGRWRKVASG